MSFSHVGGWLLLAAYLSLVLEMTVFAIPSEASTLQILGKREAATGGNLARARAQRLLSKVWRYFLPTAVGVLLFVLPLCVAIFPALRDYALCPLDTGSSGLVVGLSMVMLGRFITFTAVVQLRRRLHRGTHTLQQHGVFRFSRNPILLGMYLFYLGNAVWLPSPLLWVGFLLYAGNMHRRVLMEEGYLRNRFGEAYGSYLAEVPRYVGLGNHSPDPR